MRWRFVDTIDAFDPWRSIAGRKAVSFEEICLREPLGDEGTLPAALAIESCVQLARLLVAASTQFEQTAVLTGIDRFRILREAGMGEILRIHINVNEKGEPAVSVACRVQCGEQVIADGSFTLSLAPMVAGFDPEWTAGMWKEMCGKT